MWHSSSLQTIEEHQFLSGDHVKFDHSPNGKTTDKSNCITYFLWDSKGWWCVRVTHLWTFVAVQLFYSDQTWIQTHGFYLVTRPVVTFMITAKCTHSSKDQVFSCMFVLFCLGTPFTLLKLVLCLYSRQLFDYSIPLVPFSILNLPPNNTQS